jgi:hypothetical protein
MKEVKKYIHIIYEEMKNFTSQLWDLASYEQPFYQENTGSSHSMAFHSNHLYHEIRLPKVVVKKFDGLNPIGWFTQMEHYFSLHGITNELTKIHIGVLYLDPE